MKNTGISRAIDDLGRICLPKELRRSLGADTGAYLQIWTDSIDGESVVVLKKIPLSCAVCGKTDEKYFISGGVRVCRKCYGKFRVEE